MDTLSIPIPTAPIGTVPPVTQPGASSASMDRQHAEQLIGWIKGRPRRRKN